MRYIAHRGLTQGPNPRNENSPEQLAAAWFNGYECEIDVWYDDYKWFLGHDRPQYELSSFNWIDRSTSWLHCKNLPAFHALMNRDTSGNLKANFFWHESDQVVLTNRGYVWTYLGKPDTLGPKSICVMPELTRSFYSIAKLDDCMAICSDYVHQIKLDRSK